MAVAPTGSISYINNTSASLQPVTRLVEERQEKKNGKLYIPTPERDTDKPLLLPVYISLIAVQLSWDFFKLYALESTD